MTLRLTADLAAALYDALRLVNPWRALKLPPSDEIDFKIIKDQTVFADFIVLAGQPTIRVSESTNGQLVTLLSTIGHEMKHVHQWMTGDKEHHGVRFKAFAKRASASIGCDPKAF